MSSCRIVDDKLKFIPFKLEIEINTPDDLMEIWHRMNASHWGVEEHTNYAESFPSSCDMCEIIFDSINIKADPYKNQRARR
jgi:hypothetical protein